MKILLTNDDGIDSQGILRLGQGLETEHEVWVIAPEGNRSGSSHSITLGQPTRVRQIDKREFSCSGTPADCVMIGFMGFLPVSIDLVIAGINLGPNLGTDIVYSGTAAAARQGAFMGKPGIACSLNAYSPPFYLEYPVEFIVRNLASLCSLWASDHFLNINFPNLDTDGPTPMITFPTRRIYRDELVQFKAPNGDHYCFYGGGVPEAEMEDGSDYWSIERGNISLSPIFIHPTNHEMEGRYRNVRLWSSKT